MRITSIALLLVLLAATSACDTRNEGPGEQIGRDIDEGADEARGRMRDMRDNIEEGQNPLRERGAGERAGEAVDNAIGAAPTP